MNNFDFSFTIQDGSFSATAELGKLFNVDFEHVKQDLNAKGLDSSGICMFIFSHLIY
jgi:hypothetical protein